MTDREKLIELICATHYGNSLVGENFQEGFIAKIADNLIANGVEIPVRCKDCKYSHDHEINRNYRCHRHSRYGYSQVFDAKFTDNDFCSYGERRTE